MCCFSTKFVLLTKKGIFKNGKFNSFFSQCTTSRGEFNITNEATALKLLRKASKFAKDVLVNFLLFNNNEHFIKKQRHTLNIHTVSI